jgi:hypothetical protein
VSEGGGSSRTAAAASQTGPDDLAAELNPHETELNPHKAIPVGQPPEQITSGLSAQRAAARRHGSWKGRVRDHVACDPRRP